MADDARGEREELYCQVSCGVECVSQLDRRRRFSLRPSSASCSEIPPRASDSGRWPLNRTGGERE